MTALIIFAVVVTIGLVFYFSKGKKKDTKGGQGGTDLPENDNPNYPKQK